MGTKLRSCLWLLLVALASGRKPPEEETGEIIRQVVWPNTINLTMYVDRLPTIPKVYSHQKKHGKAVPKNITIGMYQKTVQFHRDLPPTTVFVYGTDALTASFPGPTIMAMQGVPTYVTWENHLPDNHTLPLDRTISMAMAPSGVPTVVHLHGGVIAPDSDGSAFAWFTSNFTYKGSAWTQATYTYPNVQHAGNLMYHDHALGLTRVNILAGLLGAYIIEDPALDSRLNLPSGSQYDRLLVIADRSFNVDGSIYVNKTGVNPDIHPVWRPEYFGDTMTVNGKIWPYLTVERLKYRFRIINACNARYLNLSLSNGLPFVVVGSDTSYLSAPVTTSYLLLSVAETYDVVVDFSGVTGGSVELLNTAPYPYPGGNPVGDRDSKVMNFRVSPLLPIDNSTVPAVLVNYEPLNPADATVTRYLALYEYMSPANQSTHLYINGKRLADPVTETPKTGSTELWNVINLTGDDHPLHIHLATFQAVKMQAIVDPNSNFSDCMQRLFDPILCDVASYAVGAVADVPAYEKTWKNVVKLPPSYMTTVVVKFHLVDTGKPYPFDATASPGYVYHCHILDHEDNEMIRPLTLLP